MKEDESTGSDLDQVISMLERSEIDYVESTDEDEDESDEITLDINDTVRMIFDEDGNLLEVNPIPN